VLARAIMLTAGLAVLLPAGRAAANGAFPDSDGVLVPADRSRQIVLSTNFGLIISDDGGATWQWTCERVETSGTSSYTMGAPPTDRLYSLSPDVNAGLAVSADGSCSWHRAGGALASAVASDVFPDPTDAAHVLAIGPVAGDGGAAAVVYESTDGGDTFAVTPLYTAPDGDTLTGVEIARADPRVIYVTERSPGPHPVLARSDDAGAHWTTFDLEPSIGARTARIVAVDPADPNVIYLRAIGAGSELLAVSRDGGLTVATPIALPGGALSAFARLASGTVLVAGLAPGEAGTTSGVGWRSSDGGVTFSDWTLSPMPRLRALAERDGTLYLAGSNYVDGWALATSTDEGRTLQPRMSYDQVSAVKTCVAAACQDSCDEQAGRGVWVADVCNPSADGGADAGPPPKPSSGCGCSAAASRGGSVAILVGALATGSAARRRRRGRRCSSAP